MTDGNPKQLERLHALLVTPEPAMAEAIAQRLREDGATTNQADSRSPGWEEVWDSTEKQVDILVYVFEALPAASGLPGSHEDRRDSLRAALEPLRQGMKERGFGRVIYLSSVLAKDLEGDRWASTLANQWLDGVVRREASELASSGITVNRIGLGVVEGHGRAIANPELARAVPVGRACGLDEVAAAVSFLASPAAAFITGVTLPLTGGMGLALFPEQYDQTT